MKQNYGNTFNSGREKIGEVGRLTLWITAEEFYPVGVTLLPSETYPVGTKIPAGTSVAVETLGGTPTLGGSAPVGLSYEDAYMGTDGCSLTIVTRGQINESVSEVTYTSAQKTALKGRILFIKEV